MWVYEMSMPGKHQFPVMANWWNGYVNNSILHIEIIIHCKMSNQHFNKNILTHTQYSNQRKSIAMDYEIMSENKKTMHLYIKPDRM